MEKTEKQCASLALGPVLSSLYINDLKLGITGKVAKSADDTKLFQVVKPRKDCEELQTLQTWGTGSKMASM